MGQRLAMVTKIHYLRRYTMKIPHGFLGKALAVVDHHIFATFYLATLTCSPLFVDQDPDLCVLPTEPNPLMVRRGIRGRNH
jgi:hypothetical protein